MSVVQTPAGWYDQPDGSKRYWDGNEWTESSIPGPAPVAPKKGMTAGKVVAIVIGTMVLVFGGGGLALLLVAGSAVNSAVQEIETAQSVESETGISSGLGSQDASGDVTLGEGYTEPALGWTKLPVSATNGSEERSNYSIEVNAESADGSMIYESGWVYIQNVSPGQTGVDEMLFVNDLPADAVFKVVTVERLASY